MNDIDGVSDLDFYANCIQHYTICIKNDILVL